MRAFDALQPSEQGRYSYAHGFAVVEVSEESVRAASEFVQDIVYGPETQAHVLEIVERNRTREYRDNGCCATQDFCDANMVMLDAWRSVTGRTDVPESEVIDGEDYALWDEAWAVAIAMLDAHAEDIKRDQKEGE